MTNLKSLTIAAAASVAVLGFSTTYVSADSAKPIQLAQASGSGGAYGGASGGAGASGTLQNQGSSGMGSGSSSGGASGGASGSTSMGADQCAQISDPRARQDCMQRSSGSDGASGATGNNPIGSGPGITNRGSGSK